MSASIITVTAAIAASVAALVVVGPAAAFIAVSVALLAIALKAAMSAPPATLGHLVHLQVATSTRANFAL